MHYLVTAVSVQPHRLKFFLAQSLFLCDGSFLTYFLLLATLEVQMKGGALSFLLSVLSPFSYIRPVQKSSGECRPHRADSLSFCMLGTIARYIHHTWVWDRGILLSSARSFTLFPGMASAACRRPDAVRI